MVTTLIIVFVLLVALITITMLPSKKRMSDGVYHSLLSSEPEEKKLTLVEEPRASESLETFSIEDLSYSPTELLDITDKTKDEVEKMYLDQLNRDQRGRSYAKVISVNKKTFLAIFNSPSMK